MLVWVRGLGFGVLDTVSKIKLLSSETAIQYMEADLLKIERQIEKLIAEKTKKESEEKVDIKAILQRVRKLMEHPVQLYEQQSDAIKKAQFFRLFFKDLPSYSDLESRTLKTGTLHPLLELIKKPSKLDESLMVNWSVSNWNQLRKDIIDWYELLSSESVVGYMDEVRV